MLVKVPELNYSIDSRLYAWDESTTDDWLGSEQQEEQQGAMRNKSKETIKMETMGGNSNRIE